MKKIFFTIYILIYCFISKSQYSNDIRIEQILQTDTTSMGQKLIYPHFQNNEVTILKITIPPGKSTGWHNHTFPVFAYVLKGNLTVEFENNTTRNFSENASFSEAIDIIHKGKNEGNENLILIAFYLGEKGKPLSLFTDSTQQIIKK